MYLVEATLQFSQLKKKSIGSLTILKTQYVSDDATHINDT